MNGGDAESWRAVFVLPNVELVDAIEGVVTALAPPNHPRLLALKQAQPTLRQFLTRFAWTHSAKPSSQRSSSSGPTHQPPFTRSARTPTEQASLIGLSRLRLKGEWKRVRAGELGYKMLIVSAAILALANLIPLIGAILFQVAGVDIGITPQDLLEQQRTAPAKL